MMRDHEMRIPLEDFQKTSCLMKDACQSLMSASDLGGIRGIEGQAGAAYFSVFDAMILNQKRRFFLYRAKPEAAPRSNELLTVLFIRYAGQRCRCGLRRRGPRFLRRIFASRPAGTPVPGLGSDGRTAASHGGPHGLAMVNTKKIKGSDFYEEEGGAVLLTDEGRRKVLSYWHDHKEATIQHPFLQEKMKWGLVPHA